MDSHKQFGSVDDARETNEEFRLFIEIPETDPLFDKKKKLLEDAGFDAEGSMRIKNSSMPDQIKDFLSVFIRGARVRSFNEVELYFAGDINDLGDYYSPRNEVEALHVVLQAIHKSLSSHKCTSKSVLNCLQDEAFQSIREIGSKFSEETVIVGDSSTEKEKCVLDWGVKHGVKTKLDIAHVEGAGRGAIATEDLDVGDIALEIPLSIIISEDLLCESEMYPILEKIDGISAETMLLLWSMKEKYNNNSKFRLYFDTLPKDLNTGLSFGIDAIMALEGTLLLEEIVQAKEHLRAQYDELYPVLHNHQDVFPPEMYTFEEYLWACELWYSNSMKIDFGDGNLRTCLIPIGGFLNHSTFPHIMHYGRLDTTTSSLRFPLSRPCRAGEECFLSYGKLSSSHMLTFYGFLPKGENPYDIIPLELDLAQDENSENSKATCEWSSHMVRGTWLSKNHDIFHYRLPVPLLNHLRRAQNPYWQSDIVTQEILVTDLNLLRDLACTFEGMKEALSAENVDNREMMSWDVELALQFKNLHGKMVSSILTSCKTGCELLEQELGKYID